MKSVSQFISSIGSQLTEDNVREINVFLIYLQPASINALVSPLGGILSAVVLDQIGRKKTLILINVFSIISWGLMYFSSSTNFDEMFWQIMLARFLIGERRRIRSTMR